MFYGIKVWPFYCMKLKLGKVGGGGVEEQGRPPAAPGGETSLLA